MGGVTLRRHFRLFVGRLLRVTIVYITLKWLWVKLITIVIYSKSCHPEELLALWAKIATNGFVVL